MYKYGETRAAQQAREAEERARVKAAELARLEAELDRRIAAAKAQIPPLPIRTYKPRPETLERAERIDLSRLPEPKWGGQHNLYLASLEAADYDRRAGKRVA